MHDQLLQHSTTMNGCQLAESMPLRFIHRP